MNQHPAYNVYGKMMLAFICAAITIVPAVTLAQTSPPCTQNCSYTLLAPLPCLQGDPGCTPGMQTNSVNLNQYLIYAFNLFIAIAAVAAVFMIVWGGFEYVTAASFGKKSDGKKKIWNAILGLVMVLGAYIVLKTVNPALVNISGSLVPPIQSSNPITATSGTIYNQTQASNKSGSGTTGNPTGSTGAVGGASSAPAPAYTPEDAFPASGNGAQ